MGPDSPLNVTREIDSLYQLDRGRGSQEGYVAGARERTCSVLHRRTKVTVQEKRCKWNEVPVDSTTVSGRDRQQVAPTNLDLGLYFSPQPPLQASANVLITHEVSSSIFMPVMPGILVEVTHKRWWSKLWPS